MFKLGIGLAVITGCAIALFIAPARASLTYELVQTSGTPDVLRVSMSYTVADATGVNASFRGDTVTLTGSLDNLLDFHFSSVGAPDVTLASMKARMAFCETTPWHFYCYTVKFDLDLNAEQVSFIYTDDGTSVRFLTSSGRVDQDGSRVCGTTGLCRFEGYFVQVPEPVTLSVFGIGLIGLAGMRQLSRRPT